MPHKTSVRRQLKVYSKYQERMYQRHVICPEIRLCGQWLGQMGFRCGRSVTVQPGPGCLIITLKGRKPVPLPATGSRKLPAPQTRALPPAAAQ
ncbi:MAG: SymE family type I addiction module toxin [Chitinophagaceae bacterium]